MQYAELNTSNTTYNESKEAIMDELQEGKKEK